MNGQAGPGVLLNPSQQWWEGSDGCARSRPADMKNACPAPGRAPADVNPPPAEPAHNPEPESGWDFSSSPVLSAGSPPLVQVASPALPAGAASSRPAPAGVVEGDGPSSARVALKRFAVRGVVLAAASLLVCLAGVCGSRWWSSHAYESANDSCRSAEADVNSSRRSMEQALSSAAGVDTDRASVSDPKTLETLDKAKQNAAVSKPSVSCRASSQSSQTLQSEAARASGIARSNREATGRLKEALKAVNASRREKQVSDARSVLANRHTEAEKLYEESSGKVRDETTRHALHDQLESAEKLKRSKDVGRISEASAKLQSVMNSVRDAMDQKTREEAEAQAASAPDPSSSSAGAGPGIGSPYQAPQPSARPRALAPAPAPAPAQPQSPSNNRGWSVPAPSGPDNGLPGHVPGM